MDLSKFDVCPIDPRRSGSPRVDPGWSELMEQYTSLMTLHKTVTDRHKAELNAMLARFQKETDDILHCMECVHEKMREMYRSAVFRRASVTLSPIQVTTSDIATVKTKRPKWFFLKL